MGERDRVDDLLDALDALVALLRDVGEEFWVAGLESARRSIVAGDANGLHRIESMYGGMGSFNDLQLGPPSYRVAPGDEDAVNERLRDLSGTVYGLTTDLRRDLDRS